ncbi:hypothetical protein D3C85_1409250 [compost metagenome]
MGAAGHAGQPLAHRLAETLHQVQADQFPVGRANGVAMCRIRHPVGAGLGVHHVHAEVDRHAQPEVVQRLAVGADAAAGKFDVTWLGVGEACLDVPQAVFPRIRFRRDGTAMTQGAVGRRGKWHDSWG